MGWFADIELLAELDNGKPISMVLDGDSDTGTFNMAFGPAETAYIKDVFEHKRTKEGNQINHSFTRLYSVSGRVFRLVKNYRDGSR